jgi:hypothetical protein
MAKNAKKSLLKLNLNSSKKDEQNLNSSKIIDEIAYYSLEDVETIIEAVLNEMAADPSIGVTLESTETGVKLNCITEDGEGYEVDVELDNEDGAVEDDDFADDDFSDEGFDAEPEFDVAASRRSMNSNRRKPAGRPVKRANRK